VELGFAVIVAQKWCSETQTLACASDAKEKRKSLLFPNSRMKRRLKNLQMNANR
jgi:hypothetical protein